MIPTAVVTDRQPPAPLHPLHAVILAGTVPLFLGALLSDLAYSKSFEVQWTNFASWLIAGGLVFAGIALTWALIGLFRRSTGDVRAVVYFVLLLATWMLGFINELVHARDAWAIMPTGLALSVGVTLLACAATWTGFATRRSEGAP